MFAGLKNKIKEETGDDVNKISSLFSAAPTKTLSKGRHSRQGSTTSLGSFTIDGKDDGATALMDMKLADGRIITPKEFKRLETKEDEWRKKLQKKDEEFAAQVKHIEESWRKKIEEKDKEFVKFREKTETDNKKLLSENNDLNTKVKALQVEVKQYEGYKSKICQYQEDLDQLEGFQTQEMAKIKHLLLEKEQNLVEKDKALLQSRRLIEELTSEVKRLQQADRELQDTVDNLEALRHKSEQEKASMTTKLAADEESIRHLKDRVAVLEARCRAGCVGLGAELTVDERIQGLLGERALLERLLTEAHEHLAEVKTTWSGTISSLETQVGRLCRQASEESSERRTAETVRDDLAKRLLETESTIAALEKEKKLKSKDFECLKHERDKLKEELESLRCKIDELERDVDNNVISRNKTAVTAQVQLEKKIKDIEGLENAVLDLTKSLDLEKDINKKLIAELEKIRGDCELEKKKTSELGVEMKMQTREKDALMIRNAEVSQEVELVRQELRAVQQEANELHERIDQLQDDAGKRNDEILFERSGRMELLKRIQELEASNEGKQQSLDTLSELKDSISDLESQLLEKNKTIKSLQQRVTDMKKTIQRELKVPSRAIDPGGQNGEGIITSFTSGVQSSSSSPDDSEDVNFKYLKHVLFKFLTSREYEAQHLTRAVATLLRFNAEEERLLRETMDRKMSWFGTRPKIGNSPITRTLYPPS